MRKSFAGMNAMVPQSLKKEVFSGHLFVFSNKRGDKIKIFYWDRNGYCCWYKCLEKGLFRLPKVDDKSYCITPAELGLILEAMTEHCLLPARKIHTDDTPFPILAEGKTHTGRLWVYVGAADNAPPCTIYQYSKSRSQQVPMHFFKNYQGYLQAEAYPGYDKLYPSGCIIEVACRAHCRRKFADAVKLLKTSDDLVLAEVALEYISKLYGIDKRCRSMSNHERYFYRRRFAKRLLRKFYRWLNKQTKNVLPKSLVGQAIQYTLNHWKALNNYLRDGLLHLDNNVAERAIKPFVIGRKNFCLQVLIKAQKMLLSDNVNCFITGSSMAPLLGYKLAIG